MAALNATVGAGNMRMGDLISALGTGVLPAAKLAGLSLKDVGAALALMVDEGMQADSAATRLRIEEPEAVHSALGWLATSYHEWNLRLGGDEARTATIVTALREHAFEPFG
jgi:hypothetical protein